MIAISYRREDSTGVAGRIYDRLQTEFGKGKVFMDFDSIPYGVDFRENIRGTLQKTDVLVAVIGPNWLGQRGQGGGKRIEDPADFVRLEIAGALQRGIPIIPVLVDDTPMPPATTLPAEIEGLAFRNGLTLDTGIDFHHHADRLVAGIRRALTNTEDEVVANADAGSSGAKRRTMSGPMTWTAVAAGLIFILGLLAWWIKAPLGRPVAVTPIVTPSLATAAPRASAIASPEATGTALPAATLSSSPMVTAEAELARGDALRNGVNVPQDLVEAMACYQRAAAMGNAVAAHRIGVMYATGTGVSKNEAQAADWYRRAADHGLAEAQYDLGVRYFFGLGVAKNEKVGLEFYRKAAAQGWQPAIDALHNREILTRMEKAAGDAASAAAAAKAAAQRTSSPGPGDADGSTETSGSRIYRGTIGPRNVTFQLRFGNAEQVTGSYRDEATGDTHELKGRNPPGRLLLDEYTRGQRSARLDLTKTTSANETRWSGKMQNILPNNYEFDVSFARPLRAATSAAPSPSAASPAAGKGEQSYRGRVGQYDATFQLQFGADGHVTGSYVMDVDPTLTMRLDGSNPPGKLLLEEYTPERKTGGEKLTAHLDLSLKRSGKEVRWEGMMYNVHPNTNRYPVSFARTK